MYYYYSCIIIHMLFRALQKQHIMEPSVLVDNTVNVIIISYIYRNKLNYTMFFWLAFQYYCCVVRFGFDRYNNSQYSQYYV